jgi:tRNA (guanine37-N1)-methyltransferase
VDEFVRAYNEDGREFIRKSASRLKEWRDTVKKVEIRARNSFGHRNKKTRLSDSTKVYLVPERISHFVMNLPATAIQFLGTPCDEPY